MSDLGRRETTKVEDHAYSDSKVFMENPMRSKPSAVAPIKTPYGSATSFDFQETPKSKNMLNPMRASLESPASRTSPFGSATSFDFDSSRSGSTFSSLNPMKEESTSKSSRKTLTDIEKKSSSFFSFRKKKHMSAKSNASSVGGEAMRLSDFDVSISSPPLNNRDAIKKKREELRESSRALDKVREAPSPPSEYSPKPMPLGWDEARDDEGRTYYFHRETHEVSWHRPTTPDTDINEGLPPGWKAVFDEKGRTYFANKSTGESSWDRPKGSSRSLKDASPKKKKKAKWWQKKPKTPEAPTLPEKICRANGRLRRMVQGSLIFVHAETGARLVDKTSEEIPFSR